MRQLTYFRAGELIGSPMATRSFKATLAVRTALISMGELVNPESFEWHV